jgi:ferric-dicitrate binding protein FerR (iron transport regulator)
MTKPDDYLWDRSGPPDPELERLERLLSPLAHAAPLDETRLERGRRRGRRPWLVGGVVIAVAAAAALVLLALWPGAAPRDPGGAYACGANATGFAFTARGGSVSCGGASVPAGVLPVGGVLDTGAHQAELAIANIGRAELGAQTRVRLDRTSPQRHQLFLERGRMHARVSAPPRIFAVGTPGAHVTDLGCEYTLEIDETGAGSITVLSGKVELESGGGAIVVVPHGARARLLAGRRAGLPLMEGAAPALAEAARGYEQGDPGALPRLLAAATPDDAITVANLARVAPPSLRPAVLERLDQIFRIPAPHTLAEALADPAVLDAWMDQIVDMAMMRGALRWDRPSKYRRE